MVQRFLPITALLLGSALLLFAGGIHGLLLPVRGAAEGFSSLSLGLLGTFWAIGYVAGCASMAQVVARIGHIRAFSVMSSFAAVSILLSLVLLTPWAWLPLRAVAGFCFAGAAMIVESWLNEQTEAASRGTIFGVYTMVNLVASTAGSLSLAVGDAAGGYLFFVLGGVFYCLALVPTAISSTTAPVPLVGVRIDLGGLWRNSPVAVAAVFFVGVSNGAFGTLSAVYAGSAGLMLTAVALFASLPILAGAVSQIPVGYLSDRFDRRKVLLALGVVALLADACFITLAPQGRFANIALVCLFGAAIFAMYPVIIAHANDHAPEGTGIQTSGGLLMVFGFGSMLGPTVAGAAMTAIGNSGLFWTSISAHVGLIGFTLWRIRVSDAVAPKDKGAFVPIPLQRTPETSAMSATEEELAATEERLEGTAP